MTTIETLRAHVEGYPQGGRIPRHAHDWDQLALISDSAAVVETDSVYVVHPLLKAMWLPAGVQHSIWSPRRFCLHALALLEQLLPEARPESFSLPGPRHERARLLADYFTAHPHDSRPVEVVAADIGGASLRTFERFFVEETSLSLAAWRRQSRLIASLALLAEGRSIGEVAQAVGYESAAAFSTAFKQCFGASPSSYT